jgi:two-component system chemotaxis sensor kinase CheA
MDQSDEEVIKEFLVEANENLDKLDQKFVELEASPKDAGLLASVFRTIHSIKGVAGFLSFRKLEQLTHAGESLLALLRDRKIDLSRPIMDGLLAMVDAVRGMLNHIAQDGTDGNGDYSELIARLKGLQDAGPAAAAVVAAAEAVPAAPPTPAEATGAPAPQTPPAAAPQAASTTPPATAVPSVPAVSVAPVVAAPPEGPAKANAPKNDAPTSDPMVMSETVRLDVSLLDRLMNQTSELVLARNQLLQAVHRFNNAELNGLSQHLSMITSELQAGIMKTRMQPIKQAWAKLPRLVRDTSMQTSKKVRLVMEGEETELDRGIIEAIKDPLTHLLRNSVDHGIEIPVERLAAGKSEEGTILLRAYHEGGQVHIQVNDDGGGIKIDRVKSKAVEKGLIRPEEAATMSDREAGRLIFLPGFSTVDKVSNISGRGVGMDVVRTNIERLGGSVDVDSRAGKGSTITLKIPLTLAIVPALLIQSSGQRFAVPQVSLLELVRLEEHSKVEWVHSAPCFRLRGNLLPLLFLDGELRNQAFGREELAKVGPQHILVLKAGGLIFGLVAEEVLDSQEIVVKPLGAQLQGIHLFAGATILGDGGLALILDVLRLAGRLNSAGKEQEATAQETVVNHEDSDQALLFEVGGGRRMAIPLSGIARLERIRRDRIEQDGGGQVLQYRGEILPVAELGPMVGLPASQEGEMASMVVVHTQGRPVGLVVEGILDTVKLTGPVDALSRRAGVAGSTVVAGQVTEVLAVEELGAIAGARLAHV